jgi:hypothetical protein
MNKTLKWILIGLGIALVVFLVALCFFAMHRGGFSMMRGYGDFDRAGRGFGGFPMMGFMPMIAFGLLRGIFGLGVLTLAVIGVVLLVRNGKAKRDAQSVAAPVVPSTTPVVEKSCKHCGKTLNDDWVACPYCGKKQ